MASDGYIDQLRRNGIALPPGAGAPAASAVPLSPAGLIGALGVRGVPKPPPAAPLPPTNYVPIMSPTAIPGLVGQLAQTVGQKPMAKAPKEGLLHQLSLAQEEQVRADQEYEMARKAASGAPIVDLRKDKSKPMALNVIDTGQGPSLDAKAGDLVAPPETAPVAPRPMMGGGGGGGGPVEQWRVGPSVRAAYAKAEDAQRQAINTNEALGLEQGDREQEAYRQFGEDQAVQNQKSEQAEKNRKAVEQSYQDQFNSYADEIANEKIDPNRSWSQKNGFEKAAGIAHRALRGFLVGATGRDIGDQLEAEAARDIDAQKANLMQKRANLAAKQSAFGMAMQRFGDERTAEAAATAGLLNQMKTRIAGLAAESQSTQVKQRAAEMTANLEDRIAGHLNAMKSYGVQGTGVKPNDANVKWLSEQEQKLDVPGTEAMANHLLSMIPSNGDIPGVGRFADRLYKAGGGGGLTGIAAGAAYDAAYGQQGASIQQQAAALENSFRHALTGSSASPSEMANYEAERGAVHDADSMRRWVSNTMNVLHNKQAGARAGVRPEDVLTYEQRKGAFAPRQAAPSAPRPTFQGAGGGKK